jgi:hypothetical protein
MSYVRTSVPWLSYSRLRSSPSMQTCAPFLKAAAYENYAPGVIKKGLTAGDVEAMHGSMVSSPCMVPDSQGLGPKRRRAADRSVGRCISPG